MSQRLLYTPFPEHIDTIWFISVETEDLRYFRTFLRTQYYKARNLLLAPFSIALGIDTLSNPIDPPCSSIGANFEDTVGTK
jgi:hypothetical protein